MMGAAIAMGAAALNAELAHRQHRRGNLAGSRRAAAWSAIGFVAAIYVAFAYLIGRAF